MLQLYYNFKNPLDKKKKNRMKREDEKKGIFSHLRGASVWFAGVTNEKGGISYEEPEARS